MFAKMKQQLTVKSGMLTERVANSPSELFSALSHAQENVLPVKDVVSGAKLTRADTLTIAQINIASHVEGTIIDLTVKRCLMLCGEASIKGNCSSQ
jgi:hypothetical protein